MDGGGGPLDGRTAGLPAVGPAGRTGSPKLVLVMDEDVPSFDFFYVNRR